MIYFRDRAKELGCSNINQLGDLAIWEFIIEVEGDEPYGVGHWMIAFDKKMQEKYPEKYAALSHDEWYSWLADII